MDFNEQLRAELAEVSAQGLYRSRRIITSAQDVLIHCDGQQVVNFCSNDYLGLANHPKVIKAFKTATDKYGVGSGSAHLICGHSHEHHALEEELAEFTGRERALLFSTGYMANTGIIAGLVGREDAVFEDRLNHASLLDGGLLSGARFSRYHHADADNLQQRLQKNSARRQLVVTDGVFSMDGNIAPLKQLATVSQQQGAWLMVDDAHGFGVMGQQGQGVTEGLSVDEVPVLMGTFGKAFGTFGAFVAGSELLIETLIQKARPYVYTTALPPAIAAATRASLRLIITDSWRREKLQALHQQFCQGATQLGLELMASQSAIQPILIGDSQQATKISQALLKQGFLVSAIRPPTVPKGSARLRITFSANHQPQQIEQLLNALDTLN